MKITQASIKERQKRIEQHRRKQEEQKRAEGIEDVLNDISTYESGRTCETDIASILHRIDKLNIEIDPKIAQGLVDDLYRRHIEDQPYADALNYSLDVYCFGEEVAKSLKDGCSLLIHDLGSTYYHSISKIATKLRDTKKAAYFSKIEEQSRLSEESQAGGTSGF